jgi:flavocytochrome c
MNVFDLREGIMKQHSIQKGTSASSSHAMTRRQFSALMGIGLASVSLGSLTGCAQKHEEHTYDVIVVGSGGAGTTAAGIAAQHGAKTICIEKLPWQGGSSSIALGTFYGSGTVQQQELGITDTPDDLYNYFLKRGAEHVDLAMNRFMADHAGETINWLREDLKVPFQDTIKGNGTDKVQRGHMCKNSAYDALSAVRTFADDQGVTFAFDTDARSLIVDNGRVVGVLAHTPMDDVIYHAKTVIIASGGFCRNDDMIQTYCPDYVGVPTEVGVGLVGSGLQMGLDIGAGFAGNGGTNGILFCDQDRDLTALISQTCVWVNKNGERFVNEKAQSHDIYYKVHHEPDQHFFQIQDTKMINKLTEANKLSVEKGLKSGIIVKADTIEEAARQIGADPTATAASVAAYNQIIDSGTDSQFNKNLTSCNKIETAPFYISTFGIATHGSFGGFDINTDFQILNEEKEAIPGLYSAGEVCCGTFIYQDYPAGGCGLNFAYTSGRFAGANAAEEALQA